MKTKQEYIDALNRMVEVYDNLDGCMSAINIFNEGVHLLNGLVNEYFEEKLEIKQETNFEHYKDEIIEDCIDNIAIIKGKPRGCVKVSCNDCQFYTGENFNCHGKTVEWLKSPYEKPKYKLTKFEFDLLNTYKGSGRRQSIFNYRTLLGLQEKGYFKDIDTSIPIYDILANCEVSEK